MGDSNNDESCRLRWFLFPFGGSITFFLILLFTMRHVNRPHHPQFEVDTFTISNFTVSRNDSNKVSFAADVRLTARNPNRKQAIEFGPADAGVYYRSLSLARTTMPPFSLGEKGQAHLNASFAAVAGSFVDQSVGLDLKLSTTVKFEKSLLRRGRDGSLEVFCGGLVVGIPRWPGGGGGGLIGGPRPCRRV